MADAARGPLLIAEEVCAIGDNWDRYRAESGNVTYAEWLRTTFGEGANSKFWGSRRKARRKLGPAFAKHVHHKAAVWLIDNIADEGVLEQVKSAILAEQRRISGDQPIPQGLVVGYESVRRIGHSIMGTRPRDSRCQGCVQLLDENERLRELLKEHGIPDE